MKTWITKLCETANHTAYRSQLIQAFEQVWLIQKSMTSAMASQLIEACVNGDLPAVKEVITKQELNLSNVKDPSGLNPLHLACKHGHLDIAQYLIREQNYNPETTTPNCRTPLHLACKSGHLHIVKCLITDYKCNPHCTDNNGYTPLHAASESGNLDNVKYLITEIGCNPEVSDSVGNTPLHYASESGHLNTVQSLITEFHCDPHKTNSRGSIPLHYSCRGGALPVVKYLVSEHHCSPGHTNIHGDTPVHLACLHGHLVTVKYLTNECRCDPQIVNSNGLTPLHYACLNGQLDTVKFLLSECNCNPQCTASNNGSTPLHFACQNENLEIVKYLITDNTLHPECINADGLTPLHYACSNGHLAIIKYLTGELGCNAQIADKYGQTPLLLASWKGYLDTVTFLITECNCDPHSSDNVGNTVLHYACGEGHLEVAKYLISEEKCNPEHGNVNGFTPLHSAAMNGYLDIVKHLISDLGSNPQSGSNNGTTPLHYACGDGHLEVVKYLIREHSSSPEYANTNGVTSLHCAVINGHLAVVKYLVSECGCILQIGDSDGLTPLHYATAKGHLDIVNFLISDCNCDPQCCTNRGFAPLHYACENGHLEVAKYLIIGLKCSPECDSNNGYTPLHLAASNGHLEVVKYLTTGVNCNSETVDRNSKTPLQYACQYGHLDVAKYLITKHNCSLDCTDTDGFTPLLTAAANGHVHIMNYLITECNCNPQYRGHGGVTPLHAACGKGHLNVVEYLINEQNCDCNPECASDEMFDQVTKELNADQNPFMQAVIIPLKLSISSLTPLHFASAHGHLQIVKYLITTCNCNPDYPTGSNGITALDIAQVGGHHEIVAYLKDQYNCQSNLGRLFSNLPLSDLPSLLGIEASVVPDSDDDSNSNAFNEACNTRLHIACRDGDLATVKFHATQSCFNPSSIGMFGNTPLFEACSNGHLDIVKYLVNECECLPCCVGQEGLTPLDAACTWGHLEVAKYLVTECGCDPRNTSGAQNQVTPLNSAVITGQLEVIKWLVQEQKCSTKGNENSASPLTVACMCEQLDIIKYFLSECSSVNVTHLLVSSCVMGKPKIVRYLVDECGCDPNSGDDLGITPLHLTCGVFQSAYKEAEVRHLASLSDDSSLSIHRILLYVWQAIVYPLTLLSQVLPNTSIYIPGAYNPPEDQLDFGIAVGTAMADHESRQPTNCYLDIVKYLIAEFKCNPQYADKEGRNPLHYACASGQLQIVQYFHSEKFGDLVCTTHSGDTLLHFACKTNQIEVVQFLLSTGKCDPLCRNNEGLTPVEISTSPEIRELLDRYCKGKYPLESVVKVFVVGDPLAGKSSLSKSIQSNSGFLSSLIGQFQRVKGTRQQTAGIDSFSFSSNVFGNVVIYDFAGQREFYTSHAAFLQNSSTNMAGIFLLVVNIAKCEDDISKNLQYWMSFIQECCAHSKTKPCVIFVGSHADQLHSEDVDQAFKFLKDFSEKSDDIHQFYKPEGIVCLDCTRPASYDLGSLCSCLMESCNSIRENAESIDQRCYILHRYIRKTYINTGVQGCTLENISTDLANNSYLLPSIPAELLELFQTLHEKAQILLLENHQDIGNSWVIINIAALLETVVGSIFAPRDFPLHISPGSTGVVAKSRLCEAFSDMNIDMIIGFLEHFEFCHHLQTDWIKLSIFAEIRKEVTEDEYYLFPALVTSNNLSKERHGSSHCCGWFINSPTEYQFFTARFLHVLLLRLAFNFALPQDSPVRGNTKVETPGLKRSCSMCKNGITWSDGNGVSTLIEVKDLKTVVLVMSCMRGRETHCVRLRTQLIKAILKAKNDFCPRAFTEECIMDVESVKTWQAVEECPSNCIKYSIKYLSDRISVRAMEDSPDISLVNPDGSRGKQISQLLYFEPYSLLTSELITQMFSEDTVSQIVSGTFISELAGCLYPCNDILVQVLLPQPVLLREKLTHELDADALDSFTESSQLLRCVNILKSWAEQQGPDATYRKLRQELNNFSIFCGRNPLNLSLESGEECGEDHEVENLLPADRPTLIECIRFRGKDRRINIPQEVGLQYHQFGLFLLEDNTMARVNSIAHKHKNDVEQINGEIIQQWIAGRGRHPVTWKTLTEVLHDSELSTLAGEIEAVKCQHNPDEGVSESLKGRNIDIPASNISSGEDSTQVNIIPAKPQGTDPKLEKRNTEDVVAADIETLTEEFSDNCKRSTKRLNTTGELFADRAEVLKSEDSEQKARKEEMNSISSEVDRTERASSASMSTS